MMRSVFTGLVACCALSACGVEPEATVSAPTVDSVEPASGETASPEPVGEAAEAQGSPGAEPTTEPVGEAAQPITRAECVARWQYNLRLCDASPPNLRPACWAACAGLLGGCLAVSEG